jgi:hypothetical protein
MSVSFMTRYGMIKHSDIPKEPTILGYYMIGNLGPFLHVYLPMETVK